MPILPGTDGVDKMSKSLDNHIGINENPAQMYGKVLSIPDTVILPYFVLTTTVPRGEIAQIEKQLNDGSENPRNIKRRLAREIVSLYYSPEAAAAAENEFDRIFIDKEAPEEMQEWILPGREGEISLLHLLSTTRMVSSNGEARRLASQGGITVDGRKITDVNEKISPGDGIVLKVGKRKFLRVKLEKTERQ
jgi:tyrosyl-tRNA synthetase